MPKSWKQWRWFAGALAVLATGAALRASPMPARGGAAAAIPDSLPIYALEQPDSASLSQRQEAFGGLGMVGGWVDRGDRIVLDRDSLHAEVFKASGGIWFENRSGLWNPSRHPFLPRPDSVRSVAGQYAQAFLPALSGPLAYQEVEGRTWAVRFHRAAQHRDDPVELDRKLTFRITVSVAGVGPVPVTGGGGELTATIGDRGKLLAMSSSVRPVHGLHRWARTITREEADRRFLARRERMRMVHWEASLAYYSAPAAYRQQFLYPVWVYTATIGDGPDTMQVRATMIPATDFVPPPYGLPSELEPTDLDLALSAHNPVDTDSELGDAPRLEAGAAFITKGLDSVVVNKQGFLDALKGAGWRINFDNGDAAAHEAAWVLKDDDPDGVDAADFVFYTGHAASDEWDLAEPDQELFHASTVGSQAGTDRWGTQDLEWLVIAACGPLQDEVVGARSIDVFRHWQGAFDGLHLFMGYGSESEDNAHEGKLLAQAALRGDPIAHAWLRVAQDVQPSVVGGQPVWAAVIFAVKNGMSTQDDHLWGRGTVAPDPNFADELVAVWTTT
jgi:hypothetical protein